jgi:hypothetical protein
MFYPFKIRDKFHQKTAMKQKKFKIEGKTLFVYRPQTNLYESTNDTNPTTGTTSTATTSGIFQK